MYITSNRIIIFHDDESFLSMLRDMIHRMNDQTICLEHIISIVLHGVVHGAQPMIERMENEITVLDERIMNNQMEGFHHRFVQLRRDTLWLLHYYEQLLDIGEELLQDENDFFAQEQLHHLHIFSDRINRLYGNVRL